MLKSLNSIGNILSMDQLIGAVVSQVSAVGGIGMFQRLYRNDRIAFAYDCFGDYGIGMAFYQEEVLGYFDDGYTRVSVRAPHGVGKSWLAALLTHHSVLTAEDDAKCITTASAWRQLEFYLWPEIKKMAKYIDWSAIGRDPYNTNTELFQMKIVLSGGLVEAFGVASDDYNTIEGAHAKKLIYIFDEAKSIPRDTWNAAEGAFANANIGKTRLDSIEDLMVEGAGVVNGLETLNPTSIRSKQERKMIKMEHRYAEITGEGNKSITLVPEGLAFQSATKFHSIPRYPVIDLKIQLPNDAKVVDVTPAPIPYIAHKNIITDTALAFSISTPGETNGQFYDIQQHRPGYEDWLTRHITVDEAIAAGRMTAEWVEMRKKQWGEGSALFQNRVLGEFADASEEGLIPRSWVLAACDRWKRWKESGAKMIPGRKNIGIDTARQGLDKTMCAVQQSMIVPIIYRYSKLTLTTLAGYVKTIADNANLNIEMDGGLGAGLYDILHSDGVPFLHPITVAAPTTWTDKSRKLKFFNVRAAMWWNMRELLDPDEGEDICLPPNEDLVLDLTAPHLEVMKDGTLLVEAKNKIRDRIGRSTDYGDAVCLSFWKVGTGGGIVF
jgi:hypothetical protein